jgi:hypothetical protein
MLVGHWPLIGNTNDYSGFNNNGTPTSITYTAGKIGQAASFNGTNSMVDLGNPSALSSIGGTTNISVSAWVFYTAFGGGGNDYSVITVKGNPWTWLMENPSNTFKFRITAGGTDTSISDTSAHLLNRWYHVVGTYDGATMKIYVDGVLKNSKAQTGVLGSNSTTAKIGTFQGTNYNFTGRINDVRVYNHTLSEYEIKKLFDSKVLHYNFNENLTSGLIYQWYNTSSYFTANSHPTTEVAFNNFFRERNTGVTLQVTGLHSGTINWGNGGQAGAGGTAGPKPSYLPNDGFSWIVSGFIYAPETGTYQFGVDGDDAIDVFVDGQNVASWYGGHGFANSWTAGSGQVSGTITLEAGKYYPFRARMEEGGGGDGIQVGWRKPSDASIALIPASFLFHYAFTSDISGYNYLSEIEVNDTPIDIRDNGLSYYDFTKSKEQKVKIKDPFLYDKTISFWIKVKPGEHTSAERVVFLVYNNGAIAAAGDTNQILLCMQDNKFQMHGWGSADPQAIKNINDGNWHHLVWQMRYDATTTANRVMNMWVDGVREVTNFNYNESGDFGPVAGKFWWLGYNSRSYSVYTRDASIQVSDLRFYGNLLTDAEVLSLYQVKANFDNLGNVSAGEFLEYTNYDSFIQQNNLVQNGLGELGNNTNFSNFVYQPSFSGFSRTSGSTTVFQDDLIPVRGNGLNSFNRYTISAEFRQLTGTASRYYFMIVCYDVNKNFIEHRMVANFSNTRTTLAQPLNNGDTIVHLTSAANWIAGTAGTTAFNKHIAIFNNPLYPIYTYTRLTRNFVTVNTSNNTITLQAAWNGGTIAAGTAVANAFDGGTFSYIGASNPLTTTSFVLRQGTSSSSASTGSMRYGSEYIRVGFLLNRDAGGAVTTDIRNIRCWNIDDPTQGFFLSTNKNMISDSSQAYYTDIDEVTGTQNTNAKQEINRNGTLFINGEFSEVD